MQKLHKIKAFLKWILIVVLALLDFNISKEIIQEKNIVK